MLLQTQLEKLGRSELTDVLHISTTDLLEGKKKQRGRSLPPSLSPPGILWAHKGKHTVKKTETLIQDADGQADRQMD